MSLHGAIDERVRAAMAEVLEPLIQRLEALEQRLQPTASTPAWTQVQPEPAAETLPETADPEPEPARRRPSRAKTSAPDA